MFAENINDIQVHPVKTMLPDVFHRNNYILDASGNSCLHPEIRDYYDRRILRNEKQKEVFDKKWKWNNIEPAMVESCNWLVGFDEDKEIDDKDKENKDKLNLLGMKLLEKVIIEMARVEAKKQQEKLHKKKVKEVEEDIEKLENQILDLQDDIDNNADDDELVETAKEEIEMKEEMLREKLVKINHLERQLHEQPHNFANFGCDLGVRWIVENYDQVKYSYDKSIVDDFFIQFNLFPKKYKTINIFNTYVLPIIIDYLKRYFCWIGKSVGEFIYRFKGYTTTKPKHYDLKVTDLDDKNESMTRTIYFEKNERYRKIPKQINFIEQEQLKQYLSSMSMFLDTYKVKIKEITKEDDDGEEITEKKKIFVPENPNKDAYDLFKFFKRQAKQYTSTTFSPFSAIPQDIVLYEADTPYLNTFFGFEILKDDAEFEINKLINTQNDSSLLKRHYNFQLYDWCWKQAQPLLQHIYSIWCKNDNEHFNYVLKWFAHLLQKPEEKPAVALVVRSDEQGAGKGIVMEIIKKIIGKKHQTQPTSKDEVFGNFNGYALDNTLLLYLDELSWGGDKDAQGKLFKLITEQEISLNKKFQDIKRENHTFFRMFFTSNSKWVVPEGMNGRRFLVLDCCNMFAGVQTQESKKYYEPIINFNPYILAYILYSIDLSAFNIRTFKKSSANQNQAYEGFTLLEKWWYNFFQNEEAPFYVCQNGGKNRKNNPEFLPKDKYTDKQLDNMTQEELNEITKNGDIHKKVERTDEEKGLQPVNYNETFTAFKEDIHNSYKAFAKEKYQMTEGAFFLAFNKMIAEEDTGVKNKRIKGKSVVVFKNKEEQKTKWLEYKKGWDFDTKQEEDKNKQVNFDKVPYIPSQYQQEKEEWEEQTEEREARQKQEQEEREERLKQAIKQRKQQEKEKKQEFNKLSKDEQREIRRKQLRESVNRELGN